MSRIGIAGSGRLAQALGRALLEAGETVVCVAGRDPRRTQLAADFIGVEAVALGELPARASRLLIAVADGAIHAVADVLARGRFDTLTALHTCGSQGIEALQPLRARGVACGTLHPLQTVCSPRQGVAALRGVAFAISGDQPALRWARQLVASLEGHALTIGAAQRPLYHAAAVMASNYLASLIDAAQIAMTTATGCDEASAMRALEPLIRTAVGNILEQGPAAALTGPIARGDIETVQSQLAALRTCAPAVEHLYRAAGLHTVDLAQRRGLAPAIVQNMKAVLQ